MNDDGAGNGVAYPIRAVDRVCDLLDALHGVDSAGASLTRLADRSGLPKSSVLRYLSALEARHYVERDQESGVYRLGAAFRPDRSRYFDALQQAALPHLMRLRDRFEETMNLAALDGDEVVHVEVAESTHRVRLAASRGERAALHSTAAGKVVAAQIPETRLRDMLARSTMPALTADTITDIDAFLADVKLSAERGFGLDDCENQPDGRCVAIAVDGLAVPAAVSLSAPASRFATEDARRIADLLHKHAAQLITAVRAVPH